LNIVTTGVKPNRILRPVTLAWLVLLSVGSLQPRRPGSVVALHREIHWAAFACAAFLLFLPTRTRFQTLQRAIAAFLLGLCLECLQHFLYHKTIEWLDVGDDALAILMALAVYWFFMKPRPAPG